MMPPSAFAFGSIGTWLGTVGVPGTDEPGVTPGIVGNCGKLGKFGNVGVGAMATDEGSESRAFRTSVATAS